MRIKEIVIYGFKSFAEKTRFEFGDGISAIIGPNGCGKSNVVDAVKWVFGEQRPTSLRGSEMADVIFNGNFKRKSMGFAEVSIVITNEERLLPVETDEVTITRRLHRDGVSEYSINKKTSRLRDIRELFMGTGAGMDTYSIIEQGKVDRLLQATPDERRKIFEEAAGISLYRARRTEAQRRLESTAQNLARLNDIAEEVEKNFNRVKRQASRARRYRELTDELKKIEVAGSIHTFHGMKAESDIVVSELREREARRRELSGRVAALEKKTSEYETAVEQHEKRFASRQSRVAELAESTTIAAGKIESGTRLVDEIESRIAAATNEITVYRERLASIRTGFESAVAELEDADLEYARKKEALDEISARAAEMEKSIVAVRREREEVSVRKAALEREKLERTNQVAAARTEVAAAAEAISAIDEKVSGLEAEAGGAASSVAEAEKFLSGAEDNLHKLSGEFTLAKERLSAAKAAAESATVHAGDLAARRAALVEKKVTAEAALERARKSSGAAKETFGIDGVYGMFSDEMQITRGYVNAVRAALAHRFGALVAAGEAIPAAVAAACGSGAGRTTFLSDAPAIAKQGRAFYCAVPGTIGKASSFVRSRKYSDLVSRLLDGVIVVEDFVSAREVLKNSTGNISAVTLGGVCFDADGTVVAGDLDGADSEALNAEAVSSVTAALASTARELAAASIARTRAEDEVRSAEKDVESLRHAVYDANYEILDAKNDLQAERDKLSRVETARADKFAESRVLAEKIEKARESEALAHERIESLRVEEAEIDIALEKSREAAAVKSAELTDARERLTSARVEAATYREKRERIREKVDRLKEDVAEKEALLAGAREQIKDGRERQEALRREIEANENLLARLKEERGELEIDLAHERETREKLRREANMVRGELKTDGERLREEDEAAGAVRMRENELRIRMENLRERIRSEYEMDLDKLHEEYEPDDCKDIDFAALGIEAEELRAKIRRFGNVNLEAVYELEELEKRHEFLTQQRADLEKAKEAIRQVIAEFDEKCHTIFEESFTTIRDNFQEYFRVLFGGGKADLVLLDEADALNSGIDIIARPPGKTPKSIRQLSGGENVMTTIALLFAIFRSRPSPFCILDEVDAALDETNIDRFLSIVNEFTKDSQFIIVTHSRRTMSVANILYGITQEENGVSKKISVRFEEDGAAA